MTATAMAKKTVAKKKGEQISLAYKKASLRPEAKKALKKGAKYLITYYQDEIAQLQAQLSATERKLAQREIDLRLKEAKIGIANSWQYRAARAEQRLAELQDGQQADAFEKEFWIEELVRYRNWVIALLREKAQQPTADAATKRRVATERPLRQSYAGVAAGAYGRPAAEKAADENPIAHPDQLGDVGELIRGDDELLAGVDPDATSLDEAQQ
jgi:hypothetical protein